MRVYSTCPKCDLVVDLTGQPYKIRTHVNCEPITDDIAGRYTDALTSDDTETINRVGRILDQPATPRLEAAALMYADTFGWPVFPLQPGGKIPATRQGFKDASTDPDQIRRWWKATPHANIGLPTGLSFDVIDVDAPGGWRSYWAMQDAGTIPDVHAIVSTAGKGLHLYVAPTGGGNLAGVMPGVDWRGAGGYVVAPPSVDTRGHNYLFHRHPSPIIKTAVTV